jgi:hypothetical protein
MRTDGQIDMTKLIVAFRNFANAPENECIFCETCKVKRFVDYVEALGTHC